MKLDPLRVSKLRDDYHQDRIRGGTLEGIFDRWGRLESRDEIVRDDLAFGVNVLVRPEPLEDRGDWAEYRAWDFAVAQERFLLGRFESVLAKTSSASDDYDLWTVERLAGHPLRSSEMLVLSGALTHEQRLLFSIGPDLAVARDTLAPLRQALPSTLWILGARGSAPILWARHDGALAAYLLDMSVFGRLIRFAPSSSGRPIDFDIELVTADTINRLAAKSRAGSLGKAWIRCFEAWSVEVSSPAIRLELA